MKKLFLLVFTALLFTNTTAVAQKKVALTTFWVSKHIGFEQLGGGVGLAAAIASLSDDPNFNLKPVLDNFYKTFTEECAQSFPFELMAKEDVVNRAEYLAYEGRFNEDKDGDRNKLFQRYFTADGVMFVSMGYDFVKKAVPFTAGVRAFVHIKLWNKEGKRVFTINEYGASKKSVGIVAGITIMKPEKLLPLCESASAQLVSDLAKKIKKMANKAAKKL